MARTASHVASTREDVEEIYQHARSHAPSSLDTANIEEEEDNPPEPSERHLHKLSGFDYLESFNELRIWSKSDVDPLARSNTPMLDRHSLHDTSPEKSSKVMLIHDYQGGYNDYEACQGASTDTDMYSCEYLQHVETFVYFSHKLVTIPPPTWINTCHRNGVYCLGTFIVEPGTKEAKAILEAGDLGGYWVASQLAAIAKQYGFDGWLVNIEQSFPLLSWSVSGMEGFLRQLRRELGPKRRVVWYDALTTLNFVWYQNTLNSLNLTFALAAGSILTNYAWNPKLAKSAHHMEEKSGLGIENVYFGIDVWAQNIQTGRHRRVTYPVKGGGGTGTGLGLGTLKELGLNAGIFAPGWSFEHFPTSNSRKVERSIWTGAELPLNPVCECLPETPHERVPYRQNGIVEHARRYPSGSRTFFHTDFTRAVYPTKGDGYFAHVGSQSVLPLPSTAFLRSTSKNRPQSRHRMYDRAVSTDLSNASPGLIISVHESREPVLPEQVSALLPLFELCISGDNTYELTASFRHPEKSACSLMLVVQRSGQQEHCIELPNEGRDVQTIISDLPLRAEPITGILLKVMCEDERLLPKSRVDILELLSITIQPSGFHASCEISGLRLEQRGDAETKHCRLVWDIEGPGDEREVESPGMPFSAITGSCAYFTVEINGSSAGRAHALEFVVPNDAEKGSRLDGTVEAQITAVGFDGRTLARSSRTLPWPTGDEDWVWVSHEDFSA